MCLSCCMGSIRLYNLRMCQCQAYIRRQIVLIFACSVFPYVISLHIAFVKLYGVSQIVIEKWCLSNYSAHNSWYPLYYLVEVWSGRRITLRPSVCPSAHSYAPGRYTDHIWCRADSRFTSSQWETPLQSNAVSHWLGANLESALWWLSDIITALAISQGDKPSSVVIVALIL